MVVKEPPVTYRSSWGDGGARPPEAPREDKVVVWAFLWTLFAFKMGTVVLIFWASKTSEAGMILSATTWPWLIIPGFAVAGTVAYRYRLMKVRAKREQLRRAEWMLDEGDAGQGAGGRKQAASSGWRSAIGAKRQAGD